MPSLTGKCSKSTYPSKSKDLKKFLIRKFKSRSIKTRLSQVRLFGSQLRELRMLTKNLNRRQQKVELKQDKTL